ncbi:MAG: DUF6675 family protein [Rectinema sp.]
MKFWVQRLKQFLLPAFIATALIGTATFPLFAQQASGSPASIPISKISSQLPAAFQAALPQGVSFQPGSPILRTAEHIGGGLMLAPSLDGASTVVDHINSAGTASNLIIEALVFLPAPTAANPYSAGTQLDSLGLLFNQFSSLQGIQYWSASRKIMRTFYTDVHRLDNPKDRNKIEDPTSAAELHTLLSRPAYIYQKDQTFDGTVTEVRCFMSQTSFLMTNTNATPLRLIGIPVLPVDGLRTGFLVAPSPEGVLLYFVTSMKSPSIGRDRVFESASNKALALLHWFVEAASARQIIVPTNLPWNFDDLPPEARLARP